AEDGIRDLIVTGVQTCALPIWTVAGLAALYLRGLGFLGGMTAERFRFDAERTMILARLTRATMQAKQRLMLLELDHPPEAGKSEIGRASCRERGEMRVVGGRVK